MYPTHDPWGREFSQRYMPHRLALSGLPIAGPYRGVLEGVQADQDFVRVLFQPARFLDNLFNMLCVPPTTGC